MMSGAMSEEIQREMPLMFVCDYAAEYAGNFIRSLIRLAEAYDGRVVYVFPERAVGKSWIELFPSEDVRLVSFDGLRFRTSCESLLAEFGEGCLVHAHFCDDVRLLELKRRFRRLVCHMHMAEEMPVKLKSYMKKMVDRPVRSMLYREMCQGVKFVGVSQPVVYDLKRRYPEMDVVCVPNGIDFSRYRGSAVPGRPINEEGLNVLAFGTHFYRKAVDVALEACGRLTSEGLEVKLVVPVHSIESCVRDVRSCWGEIPSWMQIVHVSEDVGRLYAQADCFLSPSRSEAFGYAVLEAAYMGCRVIASDVPGQNSLKDVPGVAWVPAGDAIALAKAIASSRGCLHLRGNDCLSATRAYLEEHYGIERWVERMLAVYEGVIG